MSTSPPTENYDSKNERRDSIDMPTIEETLRKENRIKEREMEGTASVVSDDLELSDDNGSNSGTSSGTSSTESTKKGNYQKLQCNLLNHNLKYRYLCSNTHIFRSHKYAFL